MTSMAPSEKTEKTATSWSTHDNACTHCRERKIRCGRERPRCANCKRDGVDCGYSTPGKRVNHIKLLCNNVGGLEDRLSNIEAELSFMNGLLKTNGSQRLSIETATEDEHSDGFPANDSFGDDSPGLPPKDRHIVRNSSNLTDRYHGPCTLVALCNEFCHSLLTAQKMQTPNSARGEPQRSKKHDRSTVNDAVKDLLDQICLEAGTEESVDLPADPTPIRLPPKQFLLMAQTQLLQQADYATDLFVQSSFWSNVERVYSRPFTSADEAWAICFNTIILLALKPESSTQGYDSQIGSHFLRPFLLTVRSALSNPRVLMAAKIVNVQALALLSIAAQMYYPLGIAESIFAQACVLARTMGLHQARSAPEGVNSEEAQERFKVFKSLYIRDKSSSISRASISWLPSFDCSVPSELDEIDPTDTKFAVRFQLARLQDESYRLSHSADSPRRSSAKYKSALLRIEQGLENWANSTQVFHSPFTSTRDVDLQLEFLAARICVLHKSPEPNHVRRALSDSRASCLLVVISSGKHESSMIEQLDFLLPSESLLKPLGGRISGRSSKSGKTSPIESAKRNTSDSVPSKFHSLFDTFSVPAFFLLATNVIWPSSAYDESQAEQDLDLLQRTSTCFREIDTRTQVNNHTRKVGRTFESLLEVVNLIKSSQQLQSPESGMQQSTNAHNVPSTGNPFGGQHRISGFSNLPSPSASSTNPISLESFSNKNTSTAAQESPSADNSPGLLTPLESHYQPYDPLRQNLFPPHMQQQIMQPPNSNRQQASDLDVSMDDYADTRLLSEFLARTSSMSFDITP